MKALIQAQISAAAMGKEKIGSGHLLIGLFRSGDEVTRCVLGDISLQDLEREVAVRYGQGEAGFSRIMGVTPHTQRVLLRALGYANPAKKTLTGVAHIWQELLFEKGCCALDVLFALGKTIDGLRASLVNAVGEIERPDPVKNIASSSEPISQQEAFAVQQAEQKQKEESKPKEELLELYARNLTLAAKRGELEPLIGREEELNAMLRVLGKKMKNNPLLIGEPGVGKSALAEGLAARVASGNVPQMLEEAQIYTLDLAQMIAGSKFRGEFEERIKKVLSCVREMKNVILFIDEIHTLVGAGSTNEGSMDAANILKPALARGEVRVIGATTYKEYRKHIEKDAALARRFQRIDVREPGKEDTLRILEGLRSRYEDYHRVLISDAALNAAIEFSARYVTDRCMPDKAIDLIDEAASMVKIGHSDWMDPGELVSIGEAEIARVVAQWTGVPVERIGADDQKDILELEETLKKRIIGQDEAIKIVARALRRSRAGLGDPKRPLGVFMLLGPSGVGKTELCKALSEALFSSEEALIRIDMSEYSEEASISRLIGSPPGYVGHGEGGQLTDAVLNRPYSVVLFDEIEKANSKIYSLLLQILDDGHLTDSVGHRVNFKNTIIVMTSNAGVSFDMDRHLGFASAEANDPGRTIMAQVKQTFRPEFLGRIDELVLMRSLNEADGAQIASLMLGRIVQRLAKRSIMLEYDENVPALLAKKGVDATSGARNLRRVIAANIENPLSDLLLTGKIESGKVVIATDGDIFHVSACEDRMALPCAECVNGLQ